MRADLEKIVWAATCHPKIRSWKFTLLNLCHHANTAGEAYPSIAKIAQETGYSQKAVIDAVAGLESLGIIRKSGSCGMRKRVSVYLLTGLSTNVHKLANGEMSSCLQNPNSEVSSVENGFNGEVSSPNSEVSSCRNIIGIKKVSKLVCAGANSEVTSPFVDKSQKAGQNNSAEGSLPPHGSGPRQIAPSARNDGTPSASDEPDYPKLVRTPGWKPSTIPEREYCMYHCYTLGASRSEAEEFVRFNAIRRWTCCDYGTVNDAAKAWVKKWQSDYPDDYWAERNRRRKADATRTLT